MLFLNKLLLNNGIVKEIIEYKIIEIVKKEYGILAYKRYLKKFLNLSLFKLNNT